MKEDFNTKEHIDELIVKFWGKEITPEEEDDLRAWISESKENRRHFIAMQYLWNNAGSNDETKYDSNEAFQYFKDRTGMDTFRTSTKTINIYKVLRYAAIIVLAFALGRLSYYVFNNHNFQSDSKQFSIRVPNGSKTRIELPDKSVVWLNSGSTISYSKNFGQKDRNVKLSGEGYFEIIHNAAKPFIVHTNHSTITDLGTKFDVRAYPDDKISSVTLLKGSVKMTTIYQPKRVFKLKPNQSVVIDKEQKHVAVKQVAASDAAAWIKGEIIFKKELFGDIVRCLERDYNVKIIVKDTSLNNKCFFGDFQHTQSIEEILNIMTYSHQFHYKMKDNVITVFK